VASAGQFDAAASALSTYAAGEPVLDAANRHLTIPVSKGAGILPDVVRDLDAAGVALEDLSLRRPTLDDVFLALTGHAAEEAPAEPEAGGARRGRRRGKEESA
jgi:ABC-2 type transport system ATP-binding protein